MATSMTTSIRLSPPLRQALEAVSARLHRGKNWIMTEALKGYLVTLDQEGLKKEARRQSLLAKKQGSASDDSAWEDNLDFRGWE